MKIKGRLYNNDVPLFFMAESNSLLELEKKLLFFDKNILKRIVFNAKIYLNVRRYYMEIKNEKKLSNVLSIILNISIIFGIILTGILVYDTFMQRKIEDVIIGKGIVIVLLVLGISSLFYIVFMLKGIINTIIKGDPFVRSNVIAFKRISVSCLIISICYLINLFINSNFKGFKFIYVDNMGIHTDMEVFIFLFAAAFIYILAKVFDKAVSFKEENDLTI